MKTDRQVWIGWTLSGLFAAFMLLASVTPKLAGMPVAEQTLTDLGWPRGYAMMIGLIELAGVFLYLYKRTSLLGAVLLMAVFGGALATHLRVGSPLASHTLFSVYLGVVMWGGLWLRDPALRPVFPWRASR